MPRPLILVTVFVVSFLGFGLWSVPAEVLVSRVSGFPLGDARLELDQPRGRLWDGAARWRWRRLTGRVDWDLDWRGLTPGLQLALSGGGIELAGWLGGGSGRVRALDWQLDLPVSLIARHVDRGDAGGRLSGELRELHWRDRQMQALDGELRWSGGTVRWQPDGNADLPPLDGRLFMAEGTPRAEVTDPDGQQLADARIANGEAHLRVYRAWPMLLGVSGGGQASDVVLEVSQPVTGPGGGNG